MDQLDILKQKWQEREQEFPQLSYSDIYQMLLKKSSSIVKWIFIISIAELLFWTLLSLSVPESYSTIYSELGVETIIFIFNIISYIIIISFIYLFYKNYRSIRVTDNTKKLMSNILKTRRSVRYFVMANVSLFVISTTIISVIFYMNSSTLYEVMDFAALGVPEDNFATAFIIVQIIVGVFFVGVLALFYWLIYGILLRRLKRNYKELKLIDR